MKLLLDECLPKKLKNDLTSHDVVTVPEMGWAGIKNGELLALADKDFDVFMTIDTKLKYQQNLLDKKIAIIQLSALNNTYSSLSVIVPSILQSLENIQSCQIIIISE